MQNIVDYSRKFIWLCIVVVFLTGCGVVPRFWERGTTTPLPSPDFSATPPAAQMTSTPTPPTLQTTTLQIWVPPQFDPNNDTPEGAILQERIDEFVAQRPRVEVSVRVKALTGTGGILDSLRTAQAAAPLALPDLVVLSRPLMEKAAEDQLIFPLDDFTELMEDDNWYDYAYQLSQYKGMTMGLPFAGDVLLLAYRTSVVEEQPVNWETLLSVEEILSFPAGDPEALTTFALYQSIGGNFVEDESGLILDESPLIEVFRFYKQGQGAEVMPFWLTQFETEEQSWAAYQEEQAQLTLVWSSLYLDSTPSDTAFTSLPSLGEKTFTIANGWLWSVASMDPERQEVSVELAEFLTTDTFIANWMSDLSYLPPRPEALEMWLPDNATWEILAQILPGATIRPPQKVLDTLGPSVRDAVVSILKDQITPEEALIILDEGNSGAQ